MNTKRRKIQCCVSKPSKEKKRMESPADCIVVITFTVTFQSKVKTMLALALEQGQGRASAKQCIDDRA